MDLSPGHGRGRGHAHADAPCIYTQVDNSVEAMRRQSAAGGGRENAPIEIQLVYKYQHAGPPLLTHVVHFDRGPGVRSHAYCNCMHACNLDACQHDVGKCDACRYEGE